MPDLPSFHLSSSQFRYNTELKCWEYYDSLEECWCGPYETEDEAIKYYERAKYYEIHGEFPNEDAS